MNRESEEHPTRLWREPEKVHPTSLVRHIFNSISELGISHTLSLQGTRNSTRSYIQGWAKNALPGSTEPANPTLLTDPEHEASLKNTVSALTPSKPVLALIGSEGSGKSAMAATLACEWRRDGSLGAYLFLLPPRPTGRRKSVGGNRSEDESDGDNAVHGNSLARALSRFTSRRGSNGHAKSKNKGDIAAFEESLDRISSGMEKRERTAIIVDGMDQASEIDAKRVMAVIERFIQKKPSSKILLTLRREESPALSSIKAANLIDFVGIYGASTEEHSEADIRMENRHDISRYVSSRLAVMLTPKDQERVVDTVEGNFADAVRICRDVEESGAPERALDGILYREAVRQHGTEHVKVVLI